MKKTFVVLALFLMGAFSNPSYVSADEAGLREVMETQKQILSELREIKSELQILKVRVSQNQ